jgi:hypothetical protein
MVLWMFMLNRTINNKRLYQSELWLFIAIDQLTSVQREDEESGEIVGCGCKISKILDLGITLCPLSRR